MTISAIANRGDPVHERENTLPAFTAVAALGADMIELDLATPDGHIVVLHDQSLQGLWDLDASEDQRERDQGRPCQPDTFRTGSQRATERRKSHGD